jgi:hypothetical protein
MEIRATNRASERVMGEAALEQFEKYGHFLKRSGVEVLPGGVSGIASSTGGAAGVADQGFLLLGRNRLPDEKVVEQERGIVGKGMAHLGALLDGVSGVGELAQTFAEERQRTDFGSRMNVATLGKSIEVTARISATSIVGAAACAAVAGATGLTLAPVAVGVAAGAAAGYAVGKVAELGRWAYDRMAH